MTSNANYVTRTHFDLKMTNFDLKMTNFDLKMTKLDEKLDWLIGAFKKFDEEQTLLSGRVSDHDDRIETVENKLGIVAQ